MGKSHVCLFLLSIITQPQLKIQTGQGWVLCCCTEVQSLTSQLKIQVNNNICIVWFSILTLKCTLTRGLEVTESCPPPQHKPWPCFACWGHPDFPVHTKTCGQTFQIYPAWICLLKVFLTLKKAGLIYTEGQKREKVLFRANTKV